MDTEKIIYRSPKKHRIITVENFLRKNDIPITSTKLNICIRSGRGGMVQMEKSDDLHVPIEEFNEILNDAQAFELYTDEEHEAKARDIIESCDEETFFGDCIFSSIDYEEAFEIFMLLKRNNVPCSDVHTVFTEDNSEKYLLFIEPDDMETATKIINRIEIPETRVYDDDNDEKQDKLTNNEPHESNIFKFLIPVVIVLCLFLFKINNESIIGIIIKKIGAIISGLSGTGYIGE
jgi:hypothetical protein